MRLLFALLFLIPATAAVSPAQEAPPAAAREAAFDRAVPAALELPPRADLFAPAERPAAMMGDPRKGAVTGAIVGGVVGAVVGVWFVHGVCDAAECPAISSDSWKGAVLFGGIGAAAGAALGALIAWAEPD